jgi:hypothetical protein
VEWKWARKPADDKGNNTFAMILFFNFVKNNHQSTESFYAYV